jgi:Xaa-Pro aminopeptidase
MNDSPQQEFDTFKVPEQEINVRIAAIQAALQQAECDALFVVQRADLFYFSGTSQNAFLFIPADNEPVLFVRQFLPRAKAESGLKNIIGIQTVKEIPELVLGCYGRLPKKMAFELDVLPFNDCRFYEELFQRPSIVDGSGMVLKVRQIKSEWEILQIRATAEMTRSTFEHMRSVIRPGLTEIEFAGLFETHARKLGHGGQLRMRHHLTEGYPWHVLSGKSGAMVGLLDSPASGEGTSAAFPVGAGHKPLVPDEPIMVDMGSVKNGYHMDETRMFAIDSMPAKAMDACQAAIEIHDSVLERVAPGVTADDLYAHSLSKAAAMGYQDSYLGLPGYKVTFIGHGIGIELVEPPIIAKGKDIPLETGMTLALEPKFVFAEEFCVGIESVFEVTDSGARLISEVPVEYFIC